MTMDQIERCIEAKVDRLNQLFMAGKLSQEAYVGKIAAVQAWADCEYRWSEAEERAARRLHR